MSRKPLLPWRESPAVASPPRLDVADLPEAAWSTIQQARAREVAELRWRADELARMSNVDYVGRGLDKTATPCDGVVATLARANLDSLWWDGYGGGWRVYGMSSEGPATPGLIVEILSRLGA